MKRFNKPPLTSAAFSLFFDNNLSVIENRTAFFDQIKDDFPHLIFPDNKTLRYPMGDVDYYSKDLNKILRVNANLFRFIEKKYVDFSAIIKSLDKNLSLFVKTYNIAAFNTFNIIYENLIYLKEEVGKNFNDYFTLNFDFKTNKNKKFVATMGNHAFEADSGGLISLDFKPSEISPDGDIKYYHMNIGYIAGPLNNISKDKLFLLLRSSHEYIDDFFINVLTDKYKKTLE